MKEKYHIMLCKIHKLSIVQKKNKNNKSNEAKMSCYFIKICKCSIMHGKNNISTEAEKQHAMLCKICKFYIMHEKNNISNKAEIIIV